VEDYGKLCGRNGVNLKLIHEVAKLLGLGGNEVCYFNFLLLGRLPVTLPSKVFVQLAVK
jgi:hypothetical protein